MPSHVSLGQQPARPESTVVGRLISLMSDPISADQLRQSFLDFFEDKDHAVVPSASAHPARPDRHVHGRRDGAVQVVLRRRRGAAVPRAVSSQKCARAGGKHNDLDDVGRTKRHLVFFEMLGNFSFGDYFKEAIIPWSWDLVTADPTSGGWGMDGDRMWITVHESDDEAEAIWHEQVGVPMDRIQRLGDKDNFWQMGDTGPVRAVLGDPHRPWSRVRSRRRAAP